MKNIKYFAVAALLLLLAACGQLPPPQADASLPADFALETASYSGSSLIVKLVSGLSEAEQADVLARHNLTETASVAALRLHFVDVASGSMDATMADLQADADVQYAEREKMREVEATPADPSYSDQWALPKIGWDSVYGALSPSGTVKLAVLDTGVDAAQADLAGVLIDGFSAFEGQSPTTDPNGHGTAVAGIAAAASNDVGISGVAYAGVQIMPVQVLNAAGLGEDGNIITGLVWAADHGAKVILMAFSNPGYSPALQDAINYAWSKGAVLVAATGNDGANAATFPSGSAKVVGVSATDKNDALWSSSNYGASTFLAAPGVGIVTTAVGEGTTTISGTSASAAFVAGAAALMKANDNASNGVIVGRLARNADAVGTQEQTGNGRLNLARAINDTSTDALVPGGANPAEAGPFVGPYVAAANTFSVVVSPTTVNPSTTNTFTFTFTAANSGNPSGATTLVIPSGWTAPRTTAGAGRVTVTGCASAITVSGQQINVTQNGSGSQNSCASNTTPPESFTITYSNATAPASPGTYTFTSNHASNMNVSVASNTTTTTASSASATFGATSVILSATVSPNTVNAGTVTFTVKSGVTTIGTATSGTVSGGNASASFNLSGVNAGTYTIEAAYSGGGGFAASNNGAQSPAPTLTINKATPTISWSNPAAIEYGTALGSTQLNATASVSGTFAYTPASGTVLGAGNNQLSVIFTPSDTANYNSNTATVSISVNKKALTVSANNASREYGEANPTFAGTLTGVVSGDGITASYGSAATTASAVGTYAVTPTLSDPNNKLSNYSVSSTNGTLTVTKATLTVSADNKTREYGESNPTFTGNLTGVKNGDNISASYNSAATAASGVGPYAITAGVTGTQAVLANYNVSSTNGTLTITKALLTVTPDNQSKTYGDAFSAFTGTITGIKNGDAISANYSSAGTAATAAVAGSPYAITATLNDPNNKLGNYTVTLNQGTLTVGKATLTIKADDGSRKYGEANPAFSGSVVSGAKNGESFTVSGSSDGVATSPIGGYSIVPSASGVTIGNYDVVAQNGTLTITKATLSIAANNASRQYGGANSTLSGSYSGEKNGETFALSFSTSATAGSPVGGYPIVPSATGATLSNYDVNATNGTLTVTKAALSVEADNASREYGEANPTFAGTITGLKNDDNISASYASAANAGSAVGAYDIVATLVDPDTKAGNYAVTLNKGSLTVTKAALTVTAEGASREYGEANPTFTASYSGFKNGETLATSGVTGMPSLTTTADAGSSVASSPYTITAAAGTLAANNYSFSFVNGEFTVTKATLTIKADNASREYGDVNPPFTGSVVSGAKNDESFTVTGSSSATATSAAGSTHAIVPSANGSTLDNYTVVVQNGTLTVTKAPLSVTPADKSKTYGDTFTGFTGTLSGIKNSDAISAAYGSTGAAATADVGEYDITATLSGDKLSNYDVTSNKGKLAVNQAPLTVTANNKSREYGDANPSFDGVISGIKNSDAITASYSTTATVTSPVGTFDVIPALSGTKLGNYSVTSTNGTLTVTKATLLISGPTLSRGYGDTNPDLSGSFSGAKNDEAFAVSGSTEATATSPVNDYAIVPSASGATLSNYDVTSTNGKLTVTPASLTITANNATRVYGDANPSFGGTFSGAKNNETFTVGGTTTATQASSVGDYDIVPTVSGSTLGNYTVTKVNGTLSVTAAPISVAADNKTKVYGNANPAFTGTISGIKNSDAITASYSSVANESSSVGDYAVVPSLSGTAISNYQTPQVTNGKLTVTPAPLNVVTDNKSREYGNANPAFTGTISVIKNSDNITASYSTTATATSNVGLYVITATLSDPNSKLGNYTVTNNGGTLTITTATLMIRTDNAFRPYGQDNPTFTGSYSGAKNSETFTLSFSTSATKSSPVGTYTIVPSVTGDTLSNYTVTAANGTLTISAWSLRGFYQPVGESQSVILAPGVTLPGATGTTVWNTVKSGSTVPLKFNVFTAIGGTEVTDASQAVFSAAKLNSCSGSTSEDPVPATELSTGNTVLRYTDSQFIQNWKTPAVSADTCYRATVKMADGSTISAFFKLRK